MKPTWIVLLLVSFTFLHTGTQEHIPNPSTNEQTNSTKPTPSNNDSENQPTTTAKSDDGASTAKAVTEPPVNTSEVKPTGKETVNGSSINDHGSSTPGSGTDSKTTNTTNDTKGQSPSGQGENDLQSGQNADGETKQQETDRRILWILLPVLGVLVAGVLFVLKFKCMKVQDHAEPTENGTENASFQRSDSNKDGVMLLGVKTSGGEENVAAR
ncbi:uncharacterized protein LOC143127173 isoform X2 [Alosa pseudoharengus]|uniref:uncharacterized protein LOC143127173 isoform X2 n=1 Tax=Alosa pseudoharengus TaxID=34774 RepID=UPI003F8A6CE1